MSPSPEGGRRNARRKAFELLFEIEQHPGTGAEGILKRTFNDPDVLAGYCSDEDDEGYVLIEAARDPNTGRLKAASRQRKLQQFVSELVVAVKEHEADIDIELSKHPHDWSFDRIGTAERVLMRLAVAEMAYLGTSHKVVINEVLDLAKQYAQEDAVKFINGILGAVVRNLPQLNESANDSELEAAGEEAEQESDAEALLDSLSLIEEDAAAPSADSPFPWEH